MTRTETARWVKECQGFAINLHQMGITLSLTTAGQHNSYIPAAITYATRTSQIKPATILEGQRITPGLPAGPRQGSSEHDQRHQGPTTPQKPLKNPPPNCMSLTSPRSESTRLQTSRRPQQPGAGPGNGTGQCALSAVDEATWINMETRLGYAQLDIAWADPLSAQLAIMVSAGQLLPIGTCPAVGLSTSP
jgi:hypothetical protein